MSLQFSLGAGRGALGYKEAKLQLPVIKEIIIIILINEDLYLDLTTMNV